MYIVDRGCYNNIPQSLMSLAFFLALLPNHMLTCLAWVTQVVSKNDLSPLENQTDVAHKSIDVVDLMGSI